MRRTLPGGPGPERIGLGFQRHVGVDGRPLAPGPGHPPLALLKHVRQLVPEQRQPRGVPRLVVPGSEVDVGALGVGEGPHRVRLGALVDAHLGESWAKAASIRALTSEGRGLPSPELAARRERAARCVEAVSPLREPVPVRPHLRPGRQGGLHRLRLRERALVGSECEQTQSEEGDFAGAPSGVRNAFIR